MPTTLPHSPTISPSINPSYLHRQTTRPSHRRSVLTPPARPRVPRPLQRRAKLLDGGGMLFRGASVQTTSIQRLPKFNSWPSEPIPSSRCVQGKPRAWPAAGPALVWPGPRRRSQSWPGSQRGAACLAPACRQMPVVRATGRGASWAQPATGDPATRRRRSCSRPGSAMSAGERREEWWWR